MVKQVNVDFTFHSVGQGLFYSGKINSFNFIYDCGARVGQHLKNVVNGYIANKLANETINLLVLSHLHDDHIGGLKYIFSANIRVETVILPYLSPIERLIVAINDVNLPEWFYDFWADPANYLIDKGATVVFLGNGRGSNEGQRNSENPFDIDELPDDYSLKDNIIKQEGWQNQKTIFRNLRVKSHTQPITYSNYWLFKFFNRKIEDTNRLMEFQQDVSNITRNEDIKNTIRDKAELKKIRERYKSLNIQNLNETSLVMYHAPLQSNVMSRNLQTTPVEMTNIPNRRSINVEKSIGHFLTGDINFNINLKEMQEHFNGYLSRVESALVPHHGSAENWNKTALDLIPHSCLWITSSGITNKYGHPSPSVCDQIRKNGNLLENVNEGNEICTRESLFF